MQFNAQKLRYEALKQRYSGREIARKAGMSPATVCNILRGTQLPSATNLYKICRVLNVPVEFCFLPSDTEINPSVHKIASENK
jgi:transcriptional regulator with XRE-family HTH domain